MKYGILTYHNIPNIGAVLQAQALCKKIRQLGYDCEIIDYSCDNIIKRELNFRPLKNRLKSEIYKRFFWPNTIKKAKACLEYMRLMGIISSNVYTRKNIHESNNVYDGFISGSDMIWNTSINGHDYTYFLDFVKDGKKKLSYGSSIGDTWNENEYEIIRNLLSEYDFRSVRELDSCLFINNQFKLACETVADPTMLLSGNEWKKYSKNPKYKDSILVYFPNKRLLDAASEYRKSHGGKILVLNWDAPALGYKNIHPYSPGEWIGLIENCKAMFTNSYHGLLFSLYFHKPVWTTNNGNRQMTLLEKMGITHSLIKESRQFDSNLFNYDKIDVELAKYRESSTNYLMRALL